VDWGYVALSESGTDSAVTIGNILPTTVLDAQPHKPRGSHGAGAAETLCTFDLLQQHPLSHRNHHFVYLVPRMHKSTPDNAALALDPQMPYFRPFYLSIF
jgi:hypothetical protein